MRVRVLAVSMVLGLVPVLAPVVMPSPEPASATAAEPEEPTEGPQHELCWSAHAALECVRPDGTGRVSTPLPVPPGAPEDVSVDVVDLTPDGRRAVLYVGPDLWLADLVSGAMQPLPALVGRVSLSLSPDGELLAWTAASSNPVSGLTVYTAHIDLLPATLTTSVEPVVLTPVDEFTTDPDTTHDIGPARWSADSSSVLYTRLRPRPQECMPSAQLSVDRWTVGGGRVEVVAGLPTFVRNPIDEGCGRYTSSYGSRHVVGTTGDRPVLLDEWREGAQRSITIDRTLGHAGAAWPDSTFHQLNSFPAQGQPTVTESGTFVDLRTGQALGIAADGTRAAGAVRVGSMSAGYALHTLDLAPGPDGGAGVGVWTPVPLPEVDATFVANSSPQVWVVDRTPVPPVVFLPGVLGSEIWCDGSAETPVWPALPVFGSLMALEPDGASNASVLCPDTGVRDAEYDDDHRLVPGGSGVAESLLGVDIYGSALEQLAGVVGPDRFYAFGWDWRRDTAESVPRLDALVDQVLQETGAEQVQLVAHSYGGLLALDYASDPERREKLARVTTVGTPYLGAPKSVFSLLTGTETPFDVDSVGSMEFLFGGPLGLGRGRLQDFARNLRGMYNLWPAASFGPFLTVAGRVPAPLDADGTAALIDSVGGASALWRAGQAKHAALWDRLDLGDLPWQMVVVGGRPTMRRVTMVPATGDDPLRVGVALAPGDGTVPLRSQTLLASDLTSSVDLGVIGGEHPELGLSELCFTEHSKQMADPALYQRIGTWLLDGTRPDENLDLPCRADRAIVVETVNARLSGATPVTGSRRAALGAVSVQEAERDGLVDVLRFGERALVLVPEDADLRLRFEPEDGTTMTITPTVVDGDTRTALGSPVSSTGALDVTTSDDEVAVTPVPPPTVVNTTRPAVTGRPLVGSTLTARPGAWSVAGTTPRYQWLRSGRVIPGAAGRSYRLAAADAGRRLSVRVSAAAPGFTTGVASSAATAVVRHGARMVARWAPQRSGARVTVTVTVPTARALRPGGRVTVSLAGRQLRAATVRAGRAVLLLPGPGARARTYSVRYLGTTTVSPAVTSLRIPPRR